MNRVILSSITALLLIAALAIGYFYYEGYTENKTNPESALPPDVAFFIKGNTGSLMRDLNTLSFWKNADSASFVFELRKEINMLTEFFAVEANTNQLAQDNNAIISFQFTGVDKVDALFIFPVKKDLNIHALTDFIKGKSSGASENPTREFSGTNIYELNFAPEKKQFTYAFSSGLFIGSFTSFLVEDAIRQQGSGKIFGGDKNFTNQYKTTTGKTNLVLCAHYPKLKNFISAFVSQDKIYKLNEIGNWANWSIQHVLISNDKFVADGFITNSDTHYLSSSFTDCKSAYTHVTDILPASIIAFQTFVFTNCTEWLSSQQKTAAENEAVIAARQSVAQFENRTHVSVTEKFKTLLSSDITLAVAGTESGSYENNIIGFIKVNSAEKTETVLKTFSNLSLDKDKKKNQFENFKKHKIGLLPVDGLLTAVFGNSFSSMRKGYYTLHDNYLIVAAKVSTLRKCIEELDEEKYLHDSKNFKKVEVYLKDKCNYLLYADAASSVGLWHQIANSKNNYITGEKQDYFKSLGAFLYIVADNQQNKITCRTVLTFGQTIENKGAIVDWSFVSDALIHAGPFVVANEKSNSSFVLFQDTAQNLFCMNETGTVMWQQKLDGLIKGKMHAASYIDSGMIQLLFATDKKIYLLNEDGTSLGNYPIKLPAQTALGIYKGKNSATYFLPSINKRLYVYDVTGRPAKGWNYASTNDVVTDMHFTYFNNKEHIYFSDASSTLYLYDIDGNLIFKNTLRQPAAGHSFSVRADSTIRIIVSDSIGTIYTYNQNNDVSIRSTDYLGNVLFYLQQNIAGDNLPEHVFIHKNNVTVLKSDFSILYKFTSNETLTGKATVIKTGNKNYLLISTAQKNNYLLTEKGKIVNGFPLDGEGVTFITDEKKIKLFLKENNNVVKAYSIAE